MLVICDASPLNYLILLEETELLALLFAQVHIPQAVFDELQHPKAPLTVQRWIANPPAWLQVDQVTAPPADTAFLGHLDRGEREAILLAQELGADLILLDERVARQEAAALGLKVAGLLGVLDAAAAQGLIDLPDAIERLRRTSFRAAPQLLQALLERHDVQS